jgi:hypothetical protein
MPFYTKTTAPKILPLFSRVKIGKKPTGNLIDDRQIAIIQGIQAYQAPISYLVAIELMREMNYWVPADEVELIIESKKL